MPEPLISKVSDTARWMAAYRATESARHDALFTDPFAERFAGARGHAITAAAPRLTRNGWWWVTRTKLIDDLVTASLQNGCDRVLNLAAGFDTRPYRLDLPAATEWIEADLPELINESSVC
jgi:methyltransferase (TIGR00027 family)